MDESNEGNRDQEQTHSGGEIKFIFETCIVLKQKKVTMTILYHGGNCQPDDSYGHTIRIGKANFFANNKKSICFKTQTRYIQIQCTVGHIFLHQDTIGSLNKVEITRCLVQDVVCSCFQVFHSNKILILSQLNRMYFSPYNINQIIIC